MLSSSEREERIARGLNFINENGLEHTRAIGNAIVNPDTVNEALKKLQPFQNADGGWITNYGENHRPYGPGNSNLSA